MSAKVLVVRDEADLLAELKRLIGGPGSLLELTFVENRKQALTALQQFAFDKIVTPLKIPRVSDGYLLLGHLVKSFRRNDIIVVADSNQDETRRSLVTLGVDNLYKADDMQGIVAALRGPGVSMGATAASVAGDAATVTGTIDYGAIRSALQWVMGPVGDMIYDDALDELGSQADVATLLDFIAMEIGDPGKVQQLHERLGG